MNGIITLKNHLSNFEAEPISASDGRTYPETLLNVPLAGINQDLNGPIGLNIRCRDSSRLAANPTISGSDIILDLPKHDFERVQDMLSKSILASSNPSKLTATYRTIDGKTWVTLNLK